MMLEMSYDEFFNGLTSDDQIYILEIAYRMLKDYVGLSEDLPFNASLMPAEEGRLTELFWTLTGYMDVEGRYVRKEE